MPKETDENMREKYNEIRNFLCGAAAPHPAWGCRPRPRLGLSPQTPGFETPPPIEHPRHLPRGRRLPGSHEPRAFKNEARTGLEATYIWYITVAGTGTADKRHRR